MRQVPKYLIIGNGRVARHFCHYFSLLKIKQYSQWDRSQPLSRLHELTTDATHILLLIKDSAIEPFIDEHLTDIAPCSHIHTFNTALTQLKKDKNHASVNNMGAALKSFTEAHTLHAAARRNMVQLHKMLDSVQEYIGLPESAAQLDNAIRKLAEGITALKVSLPAATKVHFSGSLVTKKAFGAHPLMTFGPDLYSLEKYLAIPFVVDAKAPPFRDLLPNLHNPNVRLSAQQKAKYHATCVLAGNFTALLWQKFFETLTKEFEFPAHFGDMYLKQQMENLLKDYKTALTGPLVRGDMDTVNANLKALQGDPYQGVYLSFVKAYTAKGDKKSAKAKDKTS